VSGATTYVPGPGTALVGAGCVLLLPGDAGTARIAQLWPLVRDGADLDDLLEGLVARGLRSLGPFALLHGSRVVLRGSGRAGIDGSAEELTGAAVTTWAEHAVHGPAQVFLRLDAAADGEPLPVVAGVVRAAAVSVSTGSAALPVAVLTPPAPPGEVEPCRKGDDHLLGETVHPGPEEAAVRPAAPQDDPPPAPPPPPSVPAAPDADHDASTVLRSELTVERGAHRAPDTSGAPPGADEVWGVRCPAGHPNPPHGSACRGCGAPLPDAAPVPVPRPSLGLLRVNDGSETALDRTVLIGRAPSAGRSSGAGLPRLLRVHSPQQDVSRTHVEVRVEDWNVLVVDVSSNGTRLARPGAEPQMLHRGEPVLVLPGSVLDLGDGVTVAYEAGTA
jgi:hypothetical protein